MKVMSKLYVFIIVVFCYSVKAQFPNVLISTYNNPEEVSIAINPKNTNQIIAGANLNNRYKSSDGGLTWQKSTLICTAYSVYGDPVVFWDTTGNAYFMHLSNPPPSTTGGSWVDRIVIQKSTDAGTSYPQCVGVGKNGVKVQDKAWYAINPEDNSIHITWTQFDHYGTTSTLDTSLILYSKSIDEGLTWSTPKRISKIGGDCVDSDNTVEGAVPAIGPNGEVYVVWNGPNGLVFQKSLDGGTTWLAQETPVISTPNGWDYIVTGLQRCNGLPFTMCDLSNSNYKGTIYVNWSDQRIGNTDTDVFVIKSTDAGATWSLPIRVNDDAPGKHQFMSSMSIDQVTGFVYVLFYDRRNHIGNDSTDVYLAVSKDGGTSFQNYKVNQQSFKPTSSTFFGDYIGISAHNNAVRPIWMQLNSGQLSVYTAIIDAVTLSIKTEEENEIQHILVKPNPSKEEAAVSFSLNKKEKLSVQLIDSNGKIINSPITAKSLAKGNHSIVINKTELNLSTGVYYLVFYTNKKSNYIKIAFE